VQPTTDTSPAAPPIVSERARGAFLTDRRVWVAVHAEVVDMQKLRAVPKKSWGSLFDGISHELLGKRAEIAVSSLDLGDQVIAEWVPLLGFTYDSADDLLDIALDGSNHLIRHPREIAVEDAGGSVASVAVVDSEGTKQVVRLKEPLALPSTVLQSSGSDAA
jgi:hypothetical protein